MAETIISLTCSYCNGSFDRKLKQYKNNIKYAKAHDIPIRVFCSRDCQDLGKTKEKKVEIPCTGCGTPIYRNRKYAKKSTNKCADCRLKDKKEDSLASAESRFWSHVDKSPGLGPNGDCWEWKGAQKARSYNTIGLAGKSVKVHHYSHFLNTGYMPNYAAGDVVLHSCDNSPCVNPAHLKVGTHKENMADMYAKGRQSYGSRVCTAKLTEDIVTLCRRINEALPEEYPYYKLAQIFNISSRNMHKALKGETWKQFNASLTAIE